MYVRTSSSRPLKNPQHYPYVQKPKLSTLPVRWNLFRQPTHHIPPPLSTRHEYLPPHPLPHPTYGSESVVCIILNLRAHTLCIPYTYPNVNFLKEYLQKGTLSCTKGRQTQQFLIWDGLPNAKILRRTWYAKPDWVTGLRQLHSNFFNTDRDQIRSPTAGAYAPANSIKEGSLMDHSGFPRERRGTLPRVRAYHGAKVNLG